MGAYCCHGNQEAGRQTFSYFEVPLAKQHLYQIRPLLLQWFWTSCHLKNFFFLKKWPLVIKHINWIDNHLMIITARYATYHFPGYGENAIKPFSHYKSMGDFWSHGNQTKRQITTILAILNCPYPSNIYTKLESYCFSGFEGVVI